MSFVDILDPITPSTSQQNTTEHTSATGTSPDSPDLSHETSPPLTQSDNNNTSDTAESNPPASTRPVRVRTLPQKFSDYTNLPSTVLKSSNVTALVPTETSTSSLELMLTSGGKLTMARKKGSRVSKDGQGNGSTITSGKFNSGNQIQGEAGNDGGEVFGEQVEVLRYWFLLDRDMVDAIEKGNSSLVPVALAQANYLKKVIKPQLLEEGLKGEEEALWSIHRFLHNNGWWERARNLVIAKEPEEVNATDPVYDFLKGNNHFVDPNTMGRALKGERECIRRALNQIHYGSLRLLRFNGGLTPGKLSNEDINFKNKDQSNIIKDFLNSYSHLIEPSVLHEALKNDEKALALALGQIHHKTLPSQPPKGRDEMTFKDALLSPTKFGMKTSPFEGSRSPSPKASADHALLGTLHVILPALEIAKSWMERKPEFMTIEQVLLLMGYGV
ncbi:hypothetical protein ACET3Z_011160 [Daucus carota]